MSIHRRLLRLEQRARAVDPDDGPDPRDELARRLDRLAQRLDGAIVVDVADVRRRLSELLGRKIGE